MNEQPASPPAAAGLIRRLVSLCYEALLLAAILFSSGWLFLSLIQGLDPALARPLLQLYLLAIAGAYFVYCWTHGGQTLPMKTWHLRLVGRDGGAVTPSTGAIRYVLAIAGIALCGLGFVWAVFDRDRQFLHDRLAGTRLVMNAE